MAIKTSAIVLSGGSGKRMGTSVPKQYLQINGYPVLYYSLKAFQESFVDEIILVCAEEYLDYCRKEIVERYGFTKVSHIVAGGKERFDSVWQGLLAIASTDYVMIHDGARPMLSSEIIGNVYNGMQKYGTAIAAVPSKDTVKLADANGCVYETLSRRNVYMMQTPQGFEFLSIKDAYANLMQQLSGDVILSEYITDDAMVMENYGELKVHVCEGSYHNIKITTSEDMILAEQYLNTFDK